MKKYTSYVVRKRHPIWDETFFPDGVFEFWSEFFSHCLRIRIWMWIWIFLRGLSTELSPSIIFQQFANLCGYRILSFTTFMRCVHLANNIFDKLTSTEKSECMWLEWQLNRETKLKMVAIKMYKTCYHLIYTCIPSLYILSAFSASFQKNIDIIWMGKEVRALPKFTDCASVEL